MAETYKLDIDMLERSGTAACLMATRAMIARIRELERDKADWLKANAPGGWIDDLRRASQPGSGEAVVKRHLIAGAIEIIQGGADSLRECHCMNGDWGSDVEAKHAYGVEISVADGLRAALATQSPEAIDAACASLDGPREG